MPDNYLIKGITIEKDSTGSYYASFVIEYELVISKVNQHIDNIQAIGIDLGIANQVIMSNNHIKDIDTQQEYFDYVLLLGDSCGMCQDEVLDIVEAQDQ